MSPKGPLKARSASRSLPSAATRTAARLEELLGETIDPYLELPPDQVIPKARQDLPTDLEKMLRDWYMENGSGEGGMGYFGITP